MGPFWTLLQGELAQNFFCHRMVIQWKNDLLLHWILQWDFEERDFFSLCSSAKNFQLVPPFLLFPKLYFSSFLWQKRSKESLFCWLPQKWYSSSVIKFSDSEKLHMAQNVQFLLFFAIQYKNTVFENFPSKSHCNHFWKIHFLGKFEPLWTSF